MSEKPKVDPSEDWMVGRAAEHIVLADLLLQGYWAFQVDLNRPYDLLVDHQNKILKVQVKGTRGLWFRNQSSRKSHNVLHPTYRFSVRKSKGAKRKFDGEDLDVVAFVALDIRKVAYIPADDLRDGNGKLISLVEFKSRMIHYQRLGGRGPLPENGRYLQDYQDFPINRTHRLRCRRMKKLEQIP